MSTARKGVRAAQGRGRFGAGLEPGRLGVTLERGAPWVRPDLAPLFAGLDFDGFLALGEHPVRTGPDGRRHTSWFERGGRRFYLKVHTGVGWGEIAKCWLQGKRAVVDARPEAQALTLLAELGLAAPRLAGFGARGRNLARRQSFVLTESLDDTEDLAQVLARGPAPAPRLRQDLARALGHMVGRLHAAYLAHQDLYLTHFRIRRAGEGFELFLIDLHRAHPARVGTERWRRKDLAALRYSTLALPVTRGDCARFWRAYRAQLAQPATRRAERAQRTRIEARARAVRARIARRGGAD